MPRAKSGTKRKGTVVPNKTNRAKTRKIQRADEAEPKEEELVRRVTHAVLEALEDRDKSTEATATGGGTLDDNGESDSEITFRDIEVSDDEYASSEVIDTCTWSTPISAMVPQKLKQKIWEDRYIDLAALLPNNLVPGTESENYTFKLDKNSDVAVVPKKTKQSINTIYQWTTAFLRFTAVYAERFPNETPKLLKHAEIVRDMASSGIVTWQTYDKQIRMDRQVRGTSWGKINVEFILQAQRSREENKQAFRSFRPRSGQRFQGRSQFPKGVCWSFNRDGVCKLQNCKFQHICAECRKNHPKTNCRSHTVIRTPGPTPSVKAAKQQ